MVDSVDGLTSSRSTTRKNFPNFLDAGREDCFCFEQDHPELPLQEEGQPRGAEKAQKEDRFLRGRQIAFIIYDYFRVVGGHDTVLDYADLFSVTLHDVNIKEFDTRWDEVVLSVSKIPSDGHLESLYKFRVRESVKLKTVLELCNIREKKGPSLGKLQVKNPHERNPSALKFDDRSQEETV